MTCVCTYAYFDEPARCRCICTGAHIRISLKHSTAYFVKRLIRCVAVRQTKIVAIVYELDFIDSEHVIQHKKGRFL